MQRAASEVDGERYQTVFAKEPGAVAAPTAGLHLTEAIFQELDERGVEVAEIVLHVGIGTFRTLRPEDIEAQELHEEWYSVPVATRDAIARCRERGGRVVAVGTTVTRTLEAATKANESVPIASDGVTRLFLQEGYKFRCVDGLLTNFHLPQTSLLMLVSAFAGRDKIKTAYQEAILERYRFYSYGDAMLIL
jgi:S-adenosylmethionine:tRNA ribosyltransferase-isomerase